MRGHVRWVMVLGWVFATGNVGSVSGDPSVGGDRSRTGPVPVEELGPGVPDAGVNESRRDPCAKSAFAMLRACRAEIQDDYFVATARCLNLVDDQLRAECLAEAEAALQEAEGDCRDQLDARNEVCALLGQAAYDPVIVAESFRTLDEAENDPHPYFPLLRGTRWVYENEKTNESIEVTVGPEPKVIMGVECFDVRDRVQQNGRVIEDTHDWFAMDQDGNVWYFGEHSETWENDELVSLDGSWKAGVDGAKAGIIMKAAPAVDVAYRQEFALGDAEDLGMIFSVTGDASVDGYSCDGHCVVIRDFTPLEPGNESHKYYAAGVGLILAIDPETGDREVLVDFTPGPPPSPDTAPIGPPIRRLLSGVEVAMPSDGASSGSGAAIWFDLDREADVNVAVYDASGRRIESLFTGRRGIGRHTFEWRGTDAGGRRVPQGVYFVRVRAGAECHTGKVAILAR